MRMHNISVIITVKLYLKYLKSGYNNGFNTDLAAVSGSKFVG